LQKGELSHLPQQKKVERKDFPQKTLQALPQAHTAQRGKNLICILRLVYSISYNTYGLFFGEYAGIV
jgi:hypothetical protein